MAHCAHSTAAALHATRGSGLDAFRFAFSRSRRMRQGDVEYDSQHTAYNYLLSLKLLSSLLASNTMQILFELVFVFLTILKTKRL